MIKNNFDLGGGHSADVISFEIADDRGWSHAFDPSSKTDWSWPCFFPSNLLFWCLVPWGYAFYMCRHDGVRRKQLLLKTFLVRGEKATAALWFGGVRPVQGKCVFDLKLDIQPRLVKVSNIGPKKIHLGRILPIFADFSPRWSKIGGFQGFWLAVSSRKCFFLSFFSESLLNVHFRSRVGLWLFLTQFLYRKVTFESIFLF